MTIQTFADLQAQIASYLNRPNLTAQIPIFVQQAETRIYYGSEETPFRSEPLRITAMETSAYTPFDAQYVALPCDYLAMRRLYISADVNTNKELIYRTPPIFWGKYVSTVTDTPRDYTIEAGSLVLGPAPDSSYTGRLLYYRRFPALVAATDTNWILQNAPGIYLWGSLIEAYRYIRNTDEAQNAANVFAGLINSQNDSDKSEAYASPWISSPDIWTP